MNRFLRRSARIASAAAVTVLTAGCSFIGAQGDEQNKRTVTLVTHASFAVADKTLANFERRSAIDVTIRRHGDAGELTNKLVLTKANPIGDVAYGVDSTFASRALGEGVFVPYRPEGADRIPQRYSIEGSNRLTAIDVGDVCVNIDTRWFAEHGIPAPTNLRDLTDPRYRGLFAVPSPATSSPGLAFLLNTIVTFGEPGWKEYWRGLLANDVRISSGWQQAYNQDFSGSSGQGPRPIVLSYASSPAAEVGPDGSSRTRALLNTCYRQVEYAGVLKGADHPDAARRVMDFLVSQRFQAQVSEQMYVYPAVRTVALPESWQQVAPRPQRPAGMAPDRVEQNRQRWVQQWRALAHG
ncbi:thiamine transport system substrate-binding protein [Halopolyspora algeriensis]|uniref:Thiamine transport system substrate-binding protein n=1 Tax=Halopolyspora algeriensis TaxID=1500506 RepID=A0A368VS15_9ACTN|nr:thiamine ABC transporter substrate-binding protein [Halopolyspora algeriensis]RCW42756.1 thiamine transport system substrate-binding protein [Halopolyspora algeriensis]TQM56774.1 thiamine transport system substrate-binding protein [Halopolyspora algeriensis]